MRCLLSGLKATSRALYSSPLIWEGNPSVSCVLKRDVEVARIPQFWRDLMVRMRRGQRDQYGPGDWKAEGDEAGECVG